MKKVLGIDVGATGIKGALVDTTSGKMITERIKLATPKGGKPKDIIKVIDELIKKHDWTGKPTGIGFPAVIMENHVMTASNIDNSWIGKDIVQLIKKESNTECVVINDADAAGMAEMKFGHGKNKKGTVILLTLGTGIGSAVYIDGLLLPNTELGHLKFKGSVAEKLVSNAARNKRELDWKSYGKQLGEFLAHVNFLFSPTLILLGGGISKKFDNYKDYFPKHLTVKPASKQNNAGIVGAAMGWKA